MRHFAWFAGHQAEYRGPKKKGDGTTIFGRPPQSSLRDNMTKTGGADLKKLLEKRVSGS